MGRAFLVVEFSIMLILITSRGRLDYLAENPTEVVAFDYTYIIN
jgi:hypothetical protein